MTTKRTDMEHHTIELSEKTWLEIEYEVTVLIDTPAWLAHIVLPLAFALVSYRFAIDVLKELHVMTTGTAAGDAE